MRTLYHFPQSPFSRRTRLALAHKRLPVELRDARAEPALRDEARRHYPLGTIPVLVDDDGTALGDSTAIAQWLDARYPAAPLWPREASDVALALAVARHVDAALDLIVDLGTRYYALRGDAAWKATTDPLVARADAAMGEIVRLLPQGRPTVLASGWSAADMWVYTLVAWLEGLPARAPSYAPAAQMLSLGWTLPPALSRWADPHRGRDDVRGLS